MQEPSLQKQANYEEYFFFDFLLGLFWFALSCNGGLNPLLFSCLKESRIVMFCDLNVDIMK